MTKIESPAVELSLIDQILSKTWDDLANNPHFNPRILAALKQLAHERRLTTPEAVLEVVSHELKGDK